VRHQAVVEELHLRADGDARVYGVERVFVDCVPLATDRPTGVLYQGRRLDRIGVTRCGRKPRFDVGRWFGTRFAPLRYDTVECERLELATHRNSDELRAVDIVGSHRSWAEPRPGWARAERPHPLAGPSVVRFEPTIG
jgi:hypothetical protein